MIKNQSILKLIMSGLLGSLLLGGYSFGTIVMLYNRFYFAILDNYLVLWGVWIFSFSVVMIYAWSKYKKKKKWKTIAYWIIIVQAFMITLLIAFTMVLRFVFDTT